MESDTKGKKYKLGESINRLQTWIEDFRKCIQLYQEYCHVAQVQIEFNIGYDNSEVVSGYQAMVKLF